MKHVETIYFETKFIFFNVIIVFFFFLNWKRETALTSPIWLHLTEIYKKTDYYKKFIQNDTNMIKTKIPRSYLCVFKSNVVTSVFSVKDFVQKSCGSEYRVEEDQDNPSEMCMTPQDVEDG